MSLLLLLQSGSTGTTTSTASPLFVAFTDATLGVSGEATVLNPDPDSLFVLRYGDNLFGVEIDAPSSPDLTGATAVLGLDDFWTGLPIAGLSGLPVTVYQATPPVKLRFSWPSPWPGTPPQPLPVGRYRVYFTITTLAGRVCSTGDVLLCVRPV